MEDYKEVAYGIQLVPFSMTLSYCNTLCYIDFSGARCVEAR